MGRSGWGAWLTSDSPADQRFSMSVKEREIGAARARVEVSRRRIVVVVVVVGKCIVDGLLGVCVLELMELGFRLMRGGAS